MRWNTARPIRRDGRETLVALAPGPGTAEALAAVGICRRPHSRDDLRQRGNARAAGTRRRRAASAIVIFRGDGGREQLGATLSARGAHVEYVDCYRRARPASGATGLHEAFREGRIHAVTITSSEGLDNLWALCDAAMRAAWRRCPTFVPHARIAERARALGLSVVETAGSDAGLVAGLLEWAAAQPPSEELIPCRPTSSSPHRCRLSSTTRSRPTIAATITRRRPTSRRCLPRRARAIRGLVQGGGTVTPTSLLDSLPALEIISVFGVGYDGVPVDYCRKRGLKVTNTPDVLTDDVADVAVALVMMTGRGFVRLNRFAMAGEWKKRGPELTTKLGGRTVGILGLGRIGKAIAERVSAMGMKVAYTGRKPQDVGYRFVPDLKQLAAESDFLVVACPGGAATKNIVDANVLAALGKKGTIVNIARGSIIDEPALVAALSAGTIKGAGLDVFADEPNIPEPLFALDNVVLLPHVGSATRETRQAMGDLCKANLDAWFAGKPLPTLIPELA